MKHRQTTPRPQRQGFSLTELMISIGVLGVGLGMALALFPAAMREANSSQNNLLGSIICQNGLAIIKTKLQHGSGPGETLTQITEPLRPGDFLYPWNDTESGYGYAAFGRKRTPGQNDYEILVLAYGKSRAENRLELESLQGLFMVPTPAEPDATRVMFFGTMPAVGSNLIVPVASSFRSAVVQSVTALTAVLNCRIQGLEGRPSQMTVIKELTPSGTIVAKNPVMYQMVARTALRP